MCQARPCLLTKDLFAEEPNYRTSVAASLSCSACYDASRSRSDFPFCQLSSSALAMAGFLRKKSKPAEPTTTSLPPVTASASTPPLFARFATTAQPATNNAASQRMVSAPMALTGRKESVKGASAIASTSSLAAGSRQAEAGRRAVEEQWQASQPHYGYPSSSSPQNRQANHRLSVDKPLPSPVAMYAQSLVSTPPVTRRATASRTQGPPPSFQPPSKGVRSRASLDLRDLENKPLPAPGAAQAYYWQEPSSPPPSNYKFAPKTPPKRNGSVSTPATPQIAKMQPTPPAGYSSQGPPTPAAEIMGGRSISPPASKAPISRRDFPPHNGLNNTRNRPVNGMSIGESQHALSQDAHGTPMSDRALDLPPEFALFQVSSSSSVLFFFGIPKRTCTLSSVRAVHLCSRFPGRRRKVDHLLLRFRPPCKSPSRWERCVKLARPVHVGRRVAVGAGTTIYERTFGAAVVIPASCPA